MIQLKDYQKKAVNELKKKLIELLNLKEDRQRQDRHSQYPARRVDPRAARQRRVCLHPGGLGVDRPQQVTPAELHVDAQLLQREAFVKARDV